MKLSPSFSKKLEKVEGMYLTPSEIIEYLFCPRFIYFMNCLNILQHEEQRYKVMMGREIHEGRKRVNKDYLRKKINCIRKDISVYMVSDNFHLKGSVDEVLYLNDGTLAPFDYKFAEFKDTLFRTHKIQSVLYGLLIKDFYNAEVKKGYICYVRDNYLVKEILFKEKDFMEAQIIIDEIFSIIQLGFYPRKTKYSIRCVDCCYKNICV